jgi:hypothetical protein
MGKAMNAHLNHNRFFSVETDEAKNEPLRLIPSKYVDGLPPYQAIAEMEEYIEILKDVLEDHPQEPMGTPMEIGRLGSLAFEIELVRTFLASFKQVYGTMH